LYARRLARQCHFGLHRKNFHFNSAPVDGWHATLLCQLRTYKNKIGHFSKSCAARSAKRLQPTEFFETYGIATMEFTFMARSIFHTSISNDSFELNWKRVKDNCPKARARLGSENIHKLISTYFQSGRSSYK
jgi:hypothetical protein